jgi:toxin-antitoxin system PIN domain toxin
VILVDANLLLYAYNTSSQDHSGAKQWLEAVLSGHEPVALCWPVILAFVRIATNPRAFPHPLSRTEAAVIVSEWLDQPQTVVIGPGEDHWVILQRMLSGGKASGALVSDAHLAAIAVEHGATLFSTDRDFTRFPNLKVENPLEGRTRRGS